MTRRIRLLSVVSPDALFPITIGLSAFLLFTLELLSGQLVLPVFGGTPGVWATTLCFFTAVLFLGYLYAHLLVTRLDPVRAGALHLVVVVVALLSLILAPGDVSSLRAPGSPEALNVLVVLLVIAGPAAFLFASTTPLLSAWYALHRENPWWLYATSNGASFLALLAYPFVIAPVIGLAAQRSVILLGGVLFTLALATIIVAIRRGREPLPEAEEYSTEMPAAPYGVDFTHRLDVTAAAEHVGIKDEADHAAEDQAGSLSGPRTLTTRRQVIWLLAALVPAGLLSATTNFITTDLVSAPLLWIGPLAIYLLSFVIAFSARGQRLVRVAGILVPAAATLLWIPWSVGAIWPVVATLLVEMGAFLVLAVAIHGRLAGDKPDTTHLTRFYLVIAAGGMLATAFVALVAPTIFNAIYEYPILIVAGLVVLVILPEAGAPPASTKPSALIREAALRLAPYVVATALLILVISGGSFDRASPILGVFLIGGYSIAIAIWPVVLPISTGLAIVVMSLTSTGQAIFQTRTFFDVLRIDAPPGEHREFSGTTLHGTQFLDERKTEPTTYYVRAGPLGQVFEQIHANVTRPSIAIVGLGAGTTAAYALDADAFTFFEIDKAVLDIARDPRYFSYLSDAPHPARIVLGDGRLSLAAEHAGVYDLIILDAFSSDSVPVHLLTREAMATYAKTLRPGGLVVYHLSNRYYELSPAVMSTARSLGYSALAASYQPDATVVESLDGTGSTWVVVGATAAAVEPFGALGWSDRPPGPILTDDFSDLLRTLRP